MDNIINYFNNVVDRCCIVFLCVHNKQTTMKTEYTAVHCRVPNEVYDRANELLGVTQKSMANLVSNAITVYVDMVTSNSTEKANKYNPLKLDQYAYTLHEKDDKH